MRLPNSTAQRFDPPQWMAFCKGPHRFIAANFIIDETARRLFRAATAKLGQIQQLQANMVLHHAARDNFACSFPASFARRRDSIIAKIRK